MALVRVAPAYAERPLDLDQARADSIQRSLAARLQPGAPRPLYSQPRQVVATPRFLYVIDGALTLPAAPWISDQGYVEAFALARDAWREVEGDTVRALMVFSTFDEGGDALFYTPLANNVRGLGKGRATEIFDDTPDSQLEGVIWMGDYATLEAAGSAYLEEAFVHEIAHRWVAYAEVEQSGLAKDALRGRQSSHWSFLLDTQGSPMEGNAWEPRGARLSAGPRGLAPRFSMLDLYFMGVAAPEEVGQARLITAFNAVDPSWLTVGPATTPAHRLGVEVSLAPLEESQISMEAIIAGSGQRARAQLDEAVVWPIGVVLLSNSLRRATRADFEQLDRRLQSLAMVYEDATQGRMDLSLELATAGRLPLGAPCDDVAACDRSQSEICAAAPGGASMCTRACQSDNDCGPDHCCAPSAQLCALDCRHDQPLPGERPDSGLMPSDPSNPEGLQAENSACSCRGSRGGPGQWPAWGLLLGLGLRLGGGRRRGPGDRGPGQRPRRRSPPPVAAA